MRHVAFVTFVLLATACRTTSPVSRVQNTDAGGAQGPTAGFIVAANCTAGGYYGAIRLVARNAPSGGPGAELEFERYKGPDGDGDDMPTVYLRGEQVKADHGGKAWDFGSHTLSISSQATDGKLRPGVFTAKAMAGEGEGDAEVVDCEMAPSRG